MTQRVLIIGAGAHYLALASLLSNKGLKVQLIDQDESFKQPLVVAQEYSVLTNFIRDMPDCVVNDNQHNGYYPQRKRGKGKRYHR